jgi:hypothetical protein
LVAGGRTLTGDDSGGGQEVFPDLCAHVSDERWIITAIQRDLPGTICCHTWR